MHELTVLIIARFFLRVKCWTPEISASMEVRERM